MNTPAIDTTKSPYEQTVGLVLQRFRKYNAEITKFFTMYDEDYYQRETAPGKNRASYILGHLIVANDELFPFLAFGEERFPKLLELYFIADRAYPDSEYHSVPELLQYFKEVNDLLDEKFKEVPMDSWLDKHARVSDEGFAADPTRSKLGVVLNRALHANHHLGQLHLMPLPFEIALAAKSKEL